MIQLIEKDSAGWHMKINGKDCLFAVKPLALYIDNNLFPEKEDCENGLRWRVNRKWVSYNQIKKYIKIFNETNNNNNCNSVNAFHNECSKK